MTVKELILELLDMPHDAVVLHYGGDEMYHIASGVEVRDTNRDIDKKESKGPFVKLF